MTRRPCSDVLVLCLTHVLAVPFRAYQIALLGAEPADVVLKNYRPSALEALFLGAAEFAAHSPRPVHCSITGFGRGQDCSAVPAHDNVIQATAAIMARTCGAAVEPVKAGVSFVDYATGYAAAFGEHTEEVLGEPGFDAAEVGALRARGVIA